MATDPSNIEFEVENCNSQQSLAEIELWKPPQGTISQLIPVDIDLSFDKQVVQTRTGAIAVSLSGAELQLVLEGFQVVRGSKFGDEINEPYVIADITQSIRTSLEIEADSGFNFDVTVSRNPFGKIVGFLRRRKKSKSEFGVDNIAKVAVRLYRIIARNKNRWSVVEPKAPYLLKGRYLGERHNSAGAGDEKYTPLCLLNAVSLPATAKIFLRANLTDIKVTDGTHKISRNKEAVIGQIIRLSLSGRDQIIHGVQETPEQESVLLGYSILRCQDA